MEEGKKCARSDPFIQTPSNLHDPSKALINSEENCIAFKKKHGPQQTKNGEPLQTQK